MYYIDANFNENGPIKTSDIPIRFTMKFPT